MPGIVRIAPAGDAALLVELEPRIDPAINRQATMLARRLRERWGAILRDVVVGYCTVTLYFDPLRVDAPWLDSEVRAAAGPALDGDDTAESLVEVPVCYDGDLGPDLGDVAAFGGCSPDEVVQLHSSRTYRVYMVGFVPGFAYMAEVDERIAAPRRDSPRAVVPAGSVAIAAGQTGIYPSETPGGWNIIGRTPVKPYDPARGEPFLFRVGDSVRFVPVDRAAFERVA